MSNINKVLLIGKVTENPIIKNFKTGGSVTSLKILTVEKNKIKNIYNWHRVIFYNNLSKIVKKFVNKNDLVYIEGKINNRKWIDNDQNIKYITEIISNEIKILVKNKKEEIDNKIEELENFDFENNLEIQKEKFEDEDNISNDIISEIEKFSKNNEYFEYENKNNSENEENYEVEKFKKKNVKNIDKNKEKFSKNNIKNYEEEINRNNTEDQNLIDDNYYD